jgi:hypothetical protein
MPLAPWAIQKHRPESKSEKVSLLRWDVTMVDDDPELGVRDEDRCEVIRRRRALFRGIDNWGTCIVSPWQKVHHLYVFRANGSMPLTLKLMPS